MPAVLAGLVVAIHLGLAMGSTPPDIHTGGDNANYIALAGSLAQGGGYSEVWHPESPSPKYPPLYPAVLALPILAGAKTWGAFKAVSVIFTALATGLCFLWLRRLRDPRTAAAVALLFGIAPAVLYSARWILSEPLFLACTFATLWLLTPPKGASGDGTGPDGATGQLSARGLALALALAIAAYFSRSAGLPLVLAVASWLALERRWKPLGAFAVAFAALAIPWHLRPGGEYVSEFWMINPYAPDLGTAGPADLVRRVVRNLSQYALEHVPAGLTGTGGTVAGVLGVALSAGAVVGWLHSVRRRGPGVAEIVFLLYAGLILLWPEVWSSDRFALPLLPLVLLYAGDAAALGLGHAMRRPGPAMAALAGILVVLPAGRSWIDDVGFANQCRARVIALGPLSCYGANLREYRAMAQWARAGLPEGSVVFSRKPRIFYAFSGHQSLTYPFTDDGSSLLVQADSMGVGYLMAGNWDFSGPAYVHPVISAHPERFCLVAQFAAETGGWPTSLLAITPARSDDAGARAGPRTGVGTCLGDRAMPSAAALASMTVPILDNP